MVDDHRAHACGTTGTSTPPRQGRWLRLFPAILLFVSCAISIISLKNAVSKGSVSVWAYAWVVIGFMVLALYMNWASRVQHRLRFRKPQTLAEADITNVTSQQDDRAQGGQS